VRKLFREIFPESFRPGHRINRQCLTVFVRGCNDRIKPNCAESWIDLHRFPVNIDFEFQELFAAFDL
jgi:hypothetical protein